MSASPLLQTSMLVLSLVAIEPASAQWMGAGALTPSIRTVPQYNAAPQPGPGPDQKPPLVRDPLAANVVVSASKPDAVDDPELMALTELEVRELLNGRDRAVVPPAVDTFDVDFAETITVHSVSRREERITEGPAAVTVVPDEHW